MVESDFIFTIPPFACLFGEAEHIARLFTPGWKTPETFVVATLLLAADAAAKAIAGRSASASFSSTTCELGTAEHQAARASLHAYLMEKSPDVVSAAMWAAVESEQRRAWQEHVRQREVNPRKAWRPALLVIHLDNEVEFALIQQRAPQAIAVEVVDRQPASEATMPHDGWPTRCTRIGARPDVPAWAGPEALVVAHGLTWVDLVRQRVLSLAQAARAKGESVDG